MMALTLLLLATPETALAEAIACYEFLDYACAEEHLAVALAGGLEGPARERARIYEALLATAFRDMPRARRAVRALLDIDPTFDPGPDVPPQLRKLVDDMRPTPIPPPTPIARADFSSVQLNGQDADQWALGLGTEVSGGVLLRGWLTVEGTLGYSNHTPLEFAFESLDLFYGAASVGWRGELGPLRGSAGLAFGAGLADRDFGALGSEASWGGTLGAPVDVAWPLWAGFGIGARITPTLFVSSEEDQFAASFLLPLAVGVRYGP